MRWVAHEAQLRCHCTAALQGPHTGMEGDQNWSCGDQVLETVAVEGELVSCLGRSDVAEDRELTFQHTFCRHDVSCRTGHSQNSGDTDHTCCNTIYNN